MLLNEIKVLLTEQRDLSITQHESVIASQNESLIVNAQAREIQSTTMLSVGFLIALIIAYKFIKTFI